VYEWHLEAYTEEPRHDCKDFAKDEESAKISKAVIEMANNFNLGVDENDFEELLEAVLG